MSGANTQENFTRVCCQQYQTCRVQGVCVRDLRFWENELANPNPCEELITLGDLVIVDRTRSIFHGEFFGVVIRTTASVQTIYTPIDTVVRVITIRLRKVRMNRISKSWRDELIFRALRTGALVYSPEGRHNS